jgi:hypothetical protein
MLGKKSSKLRIPKPSKKKTFTVGNSLIETLKKKSYKKKRLDDINCDVFFVKIGDNYILIKNGKKETINDQKKTQFIKAFNEDNKLICSGIGPDFITESYNDSDISILQFSQSRTTPRKVTLSTRPYSLCGIICLKNLKDDVGRNGLPHSNIYLDLICSRPGIGSNLLQIAEMISKDIGKNCIYLKSVDRPLAFYLYKGYKFVSGEQTINLSDVPSFKGFFADPNCELVKHGREQRKNKTTVKFSNRVSTKRKCANVNIIEFVKGDLDNGISMYKDL